MHHRVSAIVLKGFDFKETDQILTLFTREMGKVKGIAKGVKKPKSTLRGAVQPFCCSSLYLVTSKDMFIVSQGKIDDFFGGIREDINKTLQAIYIMELLDKSMIDRDPNPALFDFTLTVLKTMAEGSVNPLLLRFYETKLMKFLGYAPVLNICSHCGEARQLTHFSLRTGGVVCSGCALQVSSTKVSPAALAVMRALLEQNLTVLSRLKVSSSVESEVECALENYLEYYLEKKFNLKSVLKDFKSGRQH
ncbi:MAG: DNA repair protein RecO [Candidatus Saccharibacteria bacterium]